MKTYFKLLSFLVFALFVLTSRDASAQYCTPYAYYPQYGYLTRVIFNGIDNSSTYNSSGYSNYSNIVSSPCVLGQTYQLQLRGYSLWGGYYPGYLLYIDWNRNNVFESSELVSYSWDYGMTSDGSFTVNVTIPMSAAKGQTRMRILYSGYYWYAWYVYYYYGPCSGYYYMEWEDYTINIVAKQNDAGIVDIVSPVDKFDSYQNQQV
ncbi:MAG: GEVED domain-containing protein, partial [Candidatus Kapaibacteriota bacterium]